MPHSPEVYFYPRSPRGERPSKSEIVPWSLLFLSTLPARGATIDATAMPSNFHISIHAPREGSDFGLCFFFGHELISIHAPREGSDPCRCACCLSLLNFYPRSPRGERHAETRRREWVDLISIHAPREGSDSAEAASRSGQSNFYPRSPRGERLVSPNLYSIVLYFYPRSPRGERLSISWPYSVRALEFLSTLPARGATAVLARAPAHHAISIHAPREGSDWIAAP